MFHAIYVSFNHLAMHEKINTMIPFIPLILSDIHSCTTCTTYRGNISIGWGGEGGRSKCRRNARGHCNYESGEAIDELHFELGMYVCMFVEECVELFFFDATYSIIVFTKNSCYLAKKKQNDE